MTKYLSINIVADNDQLALAEVKKAMLNLNNLAADLEMKTGSVKGVCWDKHNQKWRARLFRRGKMVNVGSFASLQEAASEVQKARLK